MTHPADPTPQAFPADEAAAASSFDHSLTAPLTDTGACADSLDGVTDESRVGVDLADGTQENADSAPTAAPRRRRWPIAVGIGVVAAVVVATAGYAGARAWYGWGATEPEQVLPAGAAAFARIDLNPGYRDKLAVSTMLKKFPASKRAGASGALDDLEASVVNGSGLNFADDVKPWFGDRAGFIAWPSGDDTTIPVLALASSDDGKAKKALAKVKANKDHALGYTFLDGYVLVVPGSDGGQSAVDAVAAQAKAHPMADDAKYRAAVKSLPGNNLLIAYTDFANAGPLVFEGMAYESVLTLGLPQPAALENLGFDRFAGVTVIAGASVVAGGVEVRVRAHGLPAATSPQASVEALADMGKLPAESLVAFAASGSANSSTGPLNGLLGGILGDPGDPFSPLAGDPMAGVDLGGDDALSAAMAASVQAMMTKIADGVQAVAHARLISAALTGLDDNGPSLVVKIETRDDAGTKAITSLSDVFDPMVGAKISSTGTQVEITSGTTGSGSLADSALYRSAVAAQPGTTTAAYVDVQRLLAATQASAATVSQWAPVKAVGFTMGGSGGELTGTLRVIIK